MSVWIIGKRVADVHEGVVWEFQGVCESEAEAVAACEGYPNWFVAPAQIGEILPDETAGGWPGLYFPAERVTA